MVIEIFKVWMESARRLYSSINSALLAVFTTLGACAGATAFFSLVAQPEINAATGDNRSKKASRGRVRRFFSLISSINSI
jgi:hypothetical protein